MSTPAATPLPARVVEWFQTDPRRGDFAAAGIISVLTTLIIAGGNDEYGLGWPELAAALGAFVLIACRRRQPFVLLGIALVSFGVYAVLMQRPNPLIFAVIVLLVTACIRLDRRKAIGLGVLVGVTLYLIFFLILITEAEFAESPVVIILAWTAAAVGVADAVRSWRSYKAASAAEALSKQQADEAEARRQVSEDRVEIARELHDLLAHNLSVMNVQTGAALHLLRSDPDAAEQSLITARDAGRSVLDEVRDVLNVLRSDDQSAESTTSLPTVDEVDGLVDSMRSSGLTITWTTTGTQQALAPATSLAAYRIIQEGLTNAAKHGSGRAELETKWSLDGLTIRVANEFGREPEVSTVSTGLGLTGIRERAIANGGTYSAEPIGNQFHLEAWLPTNQGDT